MKINNFTQETFHNFFISLGVPERYDEKRFFDMFNTLINSIENSNLNNLGTTTQEADAFADSINPFQLFLYMCSEFIYQTYDDSIEELQVRWEDESILSLILSISLDKYLTNEKMALNNKIYISRYNPKISTLRLYINFMSKIMEKYSQKDPNSTLIADVLSKAIRIMRCSLKLLEDGFESEAFSTWRTLHEIECILLLLSKYGTPLINSYLKHINYSLAFRRAIPEEDGDVIFVGLKEEMKKLGLKSKDIKKYIEYGYLIEIPGVLEDPTFKYNFRDGVEKLAGLSSYSKLYELSSEIAHSSPLMIYSNDETFFHLTLSLLYEAFFRIEKEFSVLYMSNISSDEVNRFLNLRKIYYGQIVKMHEDEKKYTNTKEAPII